MLRGLSSEHSRRTGGIGIEASQFYTGLVSRLYGPLRAHSYEDPEPYVRFIARAGQPALELGCGDGAPLLGLREHGLDVEGLDSSADMLERCHAAAAARGLEVTLHHQSMESMELSRTYRAIFLAGPTFNLLQDDEAALRSLHRIREHLMPDGTALIPLFVPEPYPPEAIGAAREHRTKEGELMRVIVLDQERDEVRRIQSTTLRYEFHGADGDLEVLERPWLLHWHTEDGFRELVSQAGLKAQAALGLDGLRATATDGACEFMLGRQDLDPR